MIIQIQIYIISLTFFTYFKNEDKHKSVDHVTVVWYGKDK